MKNYLFAILLIVATLFLMKCNSETSSENKATESNLVKSNWIKNATIYELNIRQFSDEGDFKSILPELNRLKKMGVKIIWLMPIHPIGEVNRKGSLGSYYSVKDYKGINQEFGSKNDFKELVDSIHAMDMKIIIDWVANHSAFDNPWVSNKEWYTLDSTGNLQPPLGTDWWDVADLNYDNEEMRNAMKDALLYWVKEFDIDGYRCDVASWVPDDFWKEAIDTLNSIKPVFMLAEAEGKNMHKAGFNITYNWSYMHVTNEIAKNHFDLSSLDSLLYVEDSIYDYNDIRMYFTSNHDENSWNGTTFERYGNQFQVQTLLAFTMPGMPLIYNGQESKLSKRLKFFDKDTIQWQDYEDEELYSKLLDLRINNSAMWSLDSNNKFKRLNFNEKKLFAYRRNNSDNEVNVFLNFGSDSIFIKNIDLDGEYYDPIHDKEYFQISSLKLNPFEGKILVKK